MNMPEYMKIRSYLYNLMMRSDRKNLQIPSENELCRIFNVSRITVRGAIQRLVQDNYLIPRRGIGTFMNPDMVGEDLRSMSCIGLIDGDGRCVHNPCEPILAMAVRQAGMNFDIIYLPDSDAPERLIEQIRTSVNGIIWNQPKSGADTYISALKEAGIPLLITKMDKNALSGTDKVLSLPEQRGKLLADYLFSKGKTRMLFVHNFSAVALRENISERSPHQIYCKRMSELAGNRYQEPLVISSSELESSMSQDKSFLKSFDVIYSLSELAPLLMEIMEKYRINIPEDISYMGYGLISPAFFNGKRPDYIDNTSVWHTAVSEWLDLRIRRKCSDGIFERNLDLTVVPGETII